MSYSSKVIEEAVDQFSSIPGVGKRTALRMVLHLLKKSPEEIQGFSSAIADLASKINYCKNCHNISDTEICQICANPSRDKSLLCVVEDIRDVIALENTQQYFGLYHVLGGIISPMEGIGPNELNIETLVQKAQGGEIREVIFALPSTMEGDTTNFYLFRKLQPTGVSVTNISRGVAVGNELEYTDEVTLGRSIVHRVPYESLFPSR